MEVAAADAGSGQSNSGNTGKANSLSDAISAAISAQRAQTAPEAEAPETPQVESVEDVAGEKRDGEDARALEPDAKPKEDGEAAKDGDAPKTFEPPAHWSEEHRKAFAALDAKSQGIVKDLAKSVQAHLTRTTQELGSKAKYAEAVSSLIDDTMRHHLARSGANEIQYFDYLNRLQQWAAQDAPAYVKWVMQNTGVTPEQLGIPAAKQPDQAQARNAELDALLSDPKVAELESKYAQLEGKLTQREQAELRARQQYEYQERQGLLGLDNSFRNALDDAGQLRFPHYDRVRPSMGSLMMSDPDLRRMPDGPEKMVAAYDMAVHARPDLRQSFVEAEVARKLAAAEKAREAARARSVTAVKPANGVATSSTKPKSLDDIIREAMGSR